VTSPSHHYRTLWISDLHIGTRECKVDLLVDFLTHHRADTLYLVGDIVDLRHIGKSRRWLRGHERAVLKLMDVMKHTHVIMTPGNHDRILRHFPEFVASNIAFVHEHIHTTPDGRRILVFHGDLMDEEIRTDVPEWKVDLACFFYYGLLVTEHRINQLRLRMGKSIKRYVGAVKSRLRFWQNYSTNYERAIVAHAGQRGFDGVVCGHIHVPKIAKHESVVYMNCGDWVENCTALAETHDGALTLLRWDRLKGPLKV